MSAANYSTTAVASAHRFEYWKEVVCRHCIPASSQPLTGKAFDGLLDVRPMGVIDVCTVSAPLHHWERTPAHLRSGPDDDIWLGFNLEGEARLEQGGRRSVLTPDQLFLYDAAQTFNFSLGGTYRLVRIPRHLLSGRVRGVENSTALALDVRRPGVVPLREMMRQVTLIPSEVQGGAISSQISQVIIDLLVLSLELQDLEAVSSERDLYYRVMNYIKKNLRDQELDLETIAKAHHVSTRTVTRAFARHDRTPMSVIWKERLLASRAALESGCVKSVSEAALEFGFSDLSHFSHAFRKAFGVSAQSLLRRSV